MQLQLMEQLLYRGDSKKIDRFDGEHSSLGQLFGSGIYLTDQPLIANQYSVTRTYNYDDEKSSNGVFRAPRESREEAIRDYIGYIMDTELNRAQRLDDMKQDYLNRMYADEPSKRNAYNNEYKASVNILMKELATQARKLIKQRIPTLRLVQSAGGWQILRNNFRGTVTTFDIPDSYIAKCLDGDVPLRDRDIKILSKFMNNWFKGSKAFRKNVGDYDDEMVTFDEWVNEYRTNGVIYAWQGRRVGRTGSNPSWDVVFNGTHSGLSLSNSKPELLIRLAQSMGYVGIAFSGGINTNGYVRGGGNSQHRSYVFWDSEYINNHIVERSEDDLENHPISTRVVTNNKLIRNGWGKNA
jgi:hypothetical protein